MIREAHWIIAPRGGARRKTAALPPRVDVSKFRIGDWLNGFFFYVHIEGEKKPTSRRVVFFFSGFFSPFSQTHLLEAVEGGDGGDGGLLGDDGGSLGDDGGAHEGGGHSGHFDC